MAVRRWPGPWCGRRLARRALAGWVASALLAATALPARAGCQFSSFSTPLAMSLGTLDPSRARTTGTARTLSLLGDCANLAQGGVQIIGGGQRVMRSASRAELPYLASLREVQGSSSAGQFTLDLEVAGASYANLPAGDYTDSLTLSLLP